MIRAFIAVEIGDDVRKALKRVGDVLRKTDSHVGWVPVENYHLSLEFLGDIDENLVAPISAAMDEAGRAIGPFCFDSVGLGSFGNPDSPRVVWAGVRAPAGLFTLQACMRDKLKELRVAVEDRPFCPHITLGRVKSKRNIAALVGAVRAHAGAEFGATNAGSFCLMRSLLKAAGAEYSQLYNVHFCGG